MQEAPPTEFPSISVKPYRSFRQPDVGGLILLLAIMLPVAILIGYLIHLIRPHFYVIAIVPLAIGFVLAGIGYLLIDRFRFRHPVLSCGIGVLVAVVAIVSTHYFDYLSCFPVITLQSLSYILQPGLFLKFMDLQAREGMGIGVYSNTAVFNFNLGYFGTYFYWLAEVGLCCFPMIRVMKAPASRPLCGKCNGWKRRQFLGSMGLNSSKAATAAVTSGNLTEIARLYRADPDRGPALSAWVCEKCAGEGEVDLWLVQHLAGETEKVLARVTCSSQVLPHLETIFFSQEEPEEEDQTASAAGE